MPADSRKTTKERIKYKRTQFGYTLKQVADYCGVSVSTVKNWEKGETYPTSREITDLAKLLHTTPNYLLVFDNGHYFVIEGTTFEEEQLHHHIHQVMKNYDNIK